MAYPILPETYDKRRRHLMRGHLMITWVFAVHEHIITINQQSTIEDKQSTIGDKQFTLGDKQSTIEDTGVETQGMR
tara:strand:+ start:58 stop:285 length:228 start_codon:yes stop_codon:yes gene_type:complete